MENWDILKEATIDAIHVDVSKKEIRLDITCVWPTRKRMEITAQGVDDFVVEEMRLSNIIDRATFYQASVNSGDVTAKRLFALMRRRAAQVIDLEWPVLLEKLQRIRDGGLIFMELEPVYGATVILLAASIKLEQWPQRQLPPPT